MATKRRHLTEAQKAAKKRQQNRQRAYNRQRQRIENIINEEIAKYSAVFEKNPLPDIPKKITDASIRRLKKITTARIIDKAWYVNPDTGETLKGSKGRGKFIPIKKDKRKNKSSVTQQTKNAENRYNKETQNWFEEVEKISEEERKRREEDEEYRRKQDDYYKYLKNLRDKGKADKKDDLPSETDNILDNILDELDRWEPSDEWGKELARRKRKQVNDAKDIINKAINRLGRDTVARICREHSEEINKLIDNVMYKYKSGDSIKAYLDYDEIISGDLVQLDDIFGQYEDDPNLTF